MSYNKINILFYIIINFKTGHLSNYSENSLLVKAFLSFRSRSRTPELSPRTLPLAPILEQPKQELESEPHPEKTILSVPRQLRRVFKHLLMLYNNYQQSC